MIRLPPEEKQQTPEQERNQKLSEVAGLVARGLDPAEASSIVDVDIGGVKLPRQFTFMPSPDKITAHSRAIRGNWSPGERNRRRVGDVRRYVIPLVRIEDIGRP